MFNIFAVEASISFRSGWGTSFARLCWRCLACYGCLLLCASAARSEDINVVLHRSYAPFPRSPIPTVSSDPKLSGSIAIVQTDPWMAYQRGRYLFQREWSRADGAYRNQSNHQLAGAANSCAHCHNLPFASAGAGGFVRDPAPYGQKALHLFGVGALEMIGQEITEQILDRYDLNRNGRIDIPSESTGKRVVVHSTPGNALDYGTFEDTDNDGLPDLNEVLMYDVVGDVDSDHNNPYGIIVYSAVLSSSVGDHQTNTIRDFAAGVFSTLFGMDVDESQPDAVDTSHVSQTACGAKNWRQPSRITNTNRAGDGKPGAALSSGELDLLEWYLLNHPEPAIAASPEKIAKGRAILASLKCTSCHVADWMIHAAGSDRRFSGDRRFFHLETRFDQSAGLRGAIKKVARPVVREDGMHWSPERREVVVRSVFSDFKHHDLGAEYAIAKSSNTNYVVMRYRTTPLWGCGSAIAFGHDGRSQSLHDAIVRHGGEATASRELYVHSTAETKEGLIAFLKALVLYEPDKLPADIDGDGEISRDFRLPTGEWGLEQFWPELLFRSKPKYQVFSDTDGQNTIRIFKLMNVNDVYGIHER